MAQPLDLVGLTEIADMFGVSRQRGTVSYEATRRSRNPLPSSRPAGSGVARNIEVWARRTGRTK